MKHRYIWVSIPREHPFYCMSWKGQLTEHRMVMAEHLGRPLSSKDIVHHKDNDPKNNNLDNLLLTNSQDHDIIHRIACLRRTLDRAKKELDELEISHSKLFSKI